MLSSGCWKSFFGCVPLALIERVPGTGWSSEYRSGDRRRCGARALDLPAAHQVVVLEKDPQAGVSRQVPDRAGLADVGVRGHRRVVPRVVGDRRSRVLVAAALRQPDTEEGGLVARDGVEARRVRGDVRRSRGAHAGPGYVCGGHVRHDAEVVGAPPPVLEPRPVLDRVP